MRLHKRVALVTVAAGIADDFTGFIGPAKR